MLKLRKTMVFTLIFIIRTSNSEQPLIHPETGLTLEQRVELNGYPMETHRVETDDDYILSLYRIPGGLQGGTNENQTQSILVFLNGMGGSPHNFIVMGKRRAPAFYFADRGMDVWLFSGRGIAGSFEEKHKKYDWAKDKEYWSYSMHEIGVYDLTASVDYILNVTGQEKVSLIGHSAGGWEIACMLADRPEYNAKVKVAISWGSSPILKSLDYPIIHLGIQLTDLIKGLWKYLGLVEAIFLHENLIPALKKLCANPNTRKMCIMGTAAIGSHKSVLQDNSLITLIVDNIPQVAAQQVFHFMDNIKNGTFRKFDYGPRKNLKIYGQTLPPFYNLTAITAPMAFFVAASDAYAIKEDIYETIRFLPNAILVYDIPFPKFTHLDFIFGSNASELVYEPMFELIRDLDNGIVPPPIKIDPDKSN